MEDKVYDILEIGRTFYHIGLRFNHNTRQMSRDLKVKILHNAWVVQGD